MSSLWGGFNDCERETSDNGGGFGREKERGGEWERNGWRRAMACGVEEN